MEAKHIHVRKGEKLAKFWLEPDVQLAKNCGMSSTEIRQISEFIEKHEIEMRRAWDEHFKF